MLFCIASIVIGFIMIPVGIYNLMLGISSETDSNNKAFAVGFGFTMLGLILVVGGLIPMVIRVL